MKQQGFEPLILNRLDFLARSLDRMDQIEFR
jgi:hypothetical protein